MFRRFLCAQKARQQETQLRGEIQLKRLTGIVLVWLLLLTLNTLAGGETFPKRVGWVNDFAGVISPEYRTRIQALITELNQKTGAQIAVVTMPTIGDEDYTDYANRLYEDWGIGQKGKDNGVMIFLTVKERKVRIEVGYGFEGILPDGRVGAILDNYAIPLLRQSQYGQGLFNATAAVASVIGKDAGVTLTGMPKMRSAREPAREGSPLRTLIPIILLLLILGGGGRLFPLLFLGSMIGGRGFGGFGGGFGGGGFGGFGGGLSGGGGAGRGF